MMFLPEDKWSPRYEPHFYTIRLKRYLIVRDPSDWPEVTAAADNYDDDTARTFCGVGSKKKYPAVYYEIEVLRGETRSSCLRRYSQFDSLCRQLDPRGALGLRKSLPPKTFTLDSWRSNDVIDERMVGLRDFLCDALARQECTNNPAIVKFLELDESEEAPIMPPRPTEMTPP